MRKREHTSFVNPVMTDEPVKERWNLQSHVPRYLHRIPNSYGMWSHRS